MAHPIELAVNGAGEYPDAFQMSDGAVNVDRQAIVVADDTTYAARAKVQNAEPASTDYGLSVRRVCVGSSVYHVVSAATTNAANIKATPGRVTGWSIFNNDDAPVYVKFHNTAGTPTAGTGVVYAIGAQAGMESHFEDDDGITFSTGIGISIVKGIADADATAVAVGDCVVNIHYK